MSRVRLLQFLLIVVLAPILMFALTIFWQAGELRSLQPLFPDDCREIQGVLGSQGIAIDKLTRTAFISADDRRSGSQGQILAYSLEEKDARPKPLTGSLSFNFHPRGISLVRERGGEVLLLAVNRRNSESTIERFRWVGEQLLHERSFRHPLIHSPNDVAALSADKFFVSVESPNSQLGRLVESVFQLARGYVVFFEGGEARVAAGGFSFANGIQLSADRTRLYVAATVGRTITVLRRSEDNFLHLEQVLDMHTGVDNLEVDLDGTIWVAAHPKLLSFLWYLRAAGRRAPSEVFRIRVFEQTLYQKTSFLMDPGGRRLSAASVAAHDAGRLLIGSAADHRFLDCRIQVPK